ncbi:transcriptional regulator ATRX homolog isoform X2 [Fopius arisanus]|uniref:Transcriptional regulator ATRX homolog isoform X2 n=1 Tax=Fopius arisanus TaxID=64838 RepID=A0A9R1T8B4_9HYME|nr:PREDICTED: transcriptional regulator ATRX homolog isoform X2 [Fopius arisanus]
MPGCSKKCGKQKKRLSKEDLTDRDSILSEGLEMKTSGKSADSFRSRSRRKDEKSARTPGSTPGRKAERRDQEDRTPPTPKASKKSKKSSGVTHDEYYSTEGSYISTPSGKKRRTPYSSETEDTSDTTKSYLKCVAMDLSKFLGEESTETESFEDDGDGIDCEDEVCGGYKVAVKKQRKAPSSSESSEEETGGSEKCPELCEDDPTKLPEEKPKKCDSNCRRKQWFERQRERRQAEMDDYLLRKGFRYFDDMCKCSLKCIMAQMCGDPFVRNFAFSTVGFLLGMKLCWELDGFYVIL